MKKCVGIQYLTDCESAVLCSNGYGCTFKGDCPEQRPTPQTKRTLVDNGKLAIDIIDQAIESRQNGIETRAWLLLKTILEERS